MELYDMYDLIVKLGTLTKPKQLLKTFKQLESHCTFMNSDLPNITIINHKIAMVKCVVDFFNHYQAIVAANITIYEEVDDPNIKCFMGNKIQVPMRITYDYVGLTNFIKYNFIKCYTYHKDGETLDYIKKGLGREN